MLNKTDFDKVMGYVPDVYAAALRSKVTKKQMGAVIVGKAQNGVWHLLAEGCNGAPTGEDHVFEEQGKTLEHIIHAEVNALNKLAALGLPDLKERFEKIVLIITSAPCGGCCKHIVEHSFITDVLWAEQNKDDASPLKNVGMRLLEHKGVTGRKLRTLDLFVTKKAATNILKFVLDSGLQKALEEIFEDLDIWELDAETTRFTHAKQWLELWADEKLTYLGQKEIVDTEQYRNLRFAVLRAFKFFHNKLKADGKTSVLELNELSIDQKQFDLFSGKKGIRSDVVASITIKCQNFSFCVMAKIDLFEVNEPLKINVQNIWANDEHDDGE